MEHTAKTNKRIKAVFLESKPGLFIYFVIYIYLIQSKYECEYYPITHKSIPFNLMNVCLCKPNSTEWALPVSVNCSVINTSLAEQMRTSLKYNFTLPISSATTHYFAFILLQFHP